MNEFKPNLYPIIYWGLFYSLLAGFVLMALSLLGRYLTVIWFPVFLLGLFFGGYRNYRKQREEFRKTSGEGIKPKPFMEEIQEAAADITTATREMLSQEARETVEAEQAEAEGGEEEEPTRPEPPANPGQPLNT
jgi:hypothetical protein